MTDELTGDVVPTLVLGVFIGFEVGADLVETRRKFWVNYDELRKQGKSKEYVHDYLSLLFSRWIRCSEEDYEAELCSAL